MHFEAADAVAALEAFVVPGGIVGEVVTKSGETFSGSLLWDQDEGAAWEILDGDGNGVEFKIEFSKLARVTNLDGGAEVELKDGRTFHLGDSNDVDSGNQGILVGTDNRLTRIDWSDVQEVRFRIP